MRALAVAAMLVAGPAQAAVEHTHDTQHSGYQESSLTFDATVDPGEGRYLLAAVVLEGGAVVTSASFAGLPLGRVAAMTSPAGHCRAEWWGLAAPPVGPGAFHIDYSAPGGHLDTTLLAYQGVAGLGSFGATTAGGLDGPTQLTLASAPGEVVLDVVCGWSPASVVELAGPDQTAHWHWSSGMMSSAISDHPGARSVTMTWTDSGPESLEWAGAGVALRAAGQRVSVGLNVHSTGCAAGGRGQGGALTMVVIVLFAFALRRRSGNIGRPVS